MYGWTNSTHTITKHGAVKKAISLINSFNCFLFLAFRPYVVSLAYSAVIFTDAALFKFL